MLFYASFFILTLFCAFGGVSCFAQITALPDLKARGRELFAAQKFEESKSIWRQVIALAKNDVEALQNLGVIEDLLGNHASAKLYLERAVQLRPNSAQDLNNLALNYLALNRVPAAPQIVRARSKDRRSKREFVVQYRRTIFQPKEIQRSHSGV